MYLSPAKIKTPPCACAVFNDISLLDKVYNVVFAIQMWKWRKSLLIIYPGSWVGSSPHFLFLSECREPASSTCALTMRLRDLEEGRIKLRATYCGQKMRWKTLHWGIDLVRVFLKNLHSLMTLIQQPREVCVEMSTVCSTPHVQMLGTRRCWYITSSAKMCAYVSHVGNSTFWENMQHGDTL